MAAAFSLASDVFSEPETSPIASLSQGRTNIYNRNSKHTKHRIAALAFALASDVFSEPGTSHIASTSQVRTNIYDRNLKSTEHRMAATAAAASDIFSEPAASHIASTSQCITDMNNRNCKHSKHWMVAFLKEGLPPCLGRSSISAVPLDMFGDVYTCHIVLKHMHSINITGCNKPIRPKRQTH
jgi:hypothetical protein